MSFDQKLLGLVDQRLSDIAIAKKCVTKARSDIERAYLEQSAVLTIYASLEGGVRDILNALLAEVDGARVRYIDLNPCYAMLALNKVCRLEQEVRGLDKQIAATKDVIREVMSVVKLPNSFDLESNLTPKVFSKISVSLGLPGIISGPGEENDLNILLRFRNNIAHGDRKMPIGAKRLDQLSGVAVSLIASTAAVVSDAYKGRVWLAGS